MQLPPEFISTIMNTFGEDGESLISNLPSLIDETSLRWQLRDVEPVPLLSFNFVAFAKHGDDDLVLKIGVPRDELTSEISALRLFHGEGACRLIDADEERGFLLLERLHPGEMLVTLKDDEEATRIAAQVMQKIWRPMESASLLAEARKQASGLQSFIRLSDWFDGLKRLRSMFNGGTGPLTWKLVERAERSAKDFLAENHMPVLMHGDFHHFNIL